jgi:drug/metabolite transporter (DMT)-like permease
MRLFLLTALTMTAFAANSLLNRLAVEGGGIDPASFALIRVAAGAAMLGALSMAQRKRLVLLSWRRLLGAGSLALYMVGFSLAYLSLDAGLGALILFGVVQITMFVVLAFQGAPASRRQTFGAFIAFAGLAWVLWPTEGGVVDPGGAALMVAAGIGWAIYTLAGRGEPDALAATAANFVLALPLMLLVSLSGGVPGPLAPAGIGLAVLSGAVTSGLGYALWYSIVPRLAPAIAATVQLSVPVIALAGGVLLLREVASVQFLTGGVLVIGGIALAARAAPKR